MPSGATASYRGYRKQALYALSRICSNRPQHFFQPEKYEDLTIFDDTSKVLEVIQVKDYSDPLSISDFSSPDKSDSFFRRSLQLVKEHPAAIIKIISFGPIGKEMADAWNGDKSARQLITKKLNRHGFTPQEIDRLFSCVSIHKEDECRLTDQILSDIQQSLTGIDPENTFDLLHYWLFKVSEKKEVITYGDLIKKINNVGRYLAERAAHHQEWFASIIPVEDSVIGQEERPGLEYEFYQGIGTQYRHILSGLDVLRQDKLLAIDSALNQKRVAVIHGASGQGKSTLAYRYLHDFFPEQWRFEIRLVENRQHALQIARALAGHANAINVPMIVYIDVSPRDVGWPDLVKELSILKNIYVLVTIREEDFRREYISRSEFDFEAIELTFNETEAVEVFNSLTAIQRSRHFLSFDEAWKRFGSKGPLLEFVYLVTQNEALQDRLRSQITRLQDLVREGKFGRNEIKMLRMVAVASAYDARLAIEPLCRYLDLIEPSRTIELFESEYLLKQSPDKRNIEGLHPIRSSIMSEFLTDDGYNPWLGLASECLPIIVEDDLEVFLLHAFSKHKKDAQGLSVTILKQQPQTWTGIAGVLRALLWYGVSEYVADNEALIRETFEKFNVGWHLVLDFDIANVSKGKAADLFKNMDFISEQTRKSIELYQDRQISKERVFIYASEWLPKRTQIPLPPATLSDWSGAAELCYWTSHLNIKTPIASALTEKDLDEAIERLPIDYFADICFALSFLWRDRFEKWLQIREEDILNRYKSETNTVHLEDDGKTVRTHFIMALKDEIKDDNKTAHSEAIWRIELLRKLFPIRQAYGSQGYGHRFEILEIPHDETVKTGIPAEHLPPQWAVTINSYFSGLGNYLFRPRTWLDYSEASNEVRKAVLESLHDLNRALAAYFRKQNQVNIFEHLSATKWDNIKVLVSRPPLFPQCAVDEWGFIREDSASPQKKNIVAAFNLMPYKRYLSASREYINSLSNFFQQSTDVILLNSAIGKAKSDEGKAVILKKAMELGIRGELNGLSTFNFAEASKNLLRFQEEFKRHFTPFIDQNLLDQLEKEEQRTIIKAWSLWYQFAFHPGRGFQNLEIEANDKLENTLSQFRKDIRRNFKKLKQKGIEARFHEGLSWDGKPVLLITYDISNPINLYESFESVISSIKSSLGTLEVNSLKYYVLEFWWPIIVIIPLVKGKSLNQTAWKISTTVFFSVSFGEEHWWHFVQHPIPEEVWNKLRLSSWTHPRIDLINRFQASFATLSILLSHFNDFARLPDLNEKGNEILQNYVLSINPKISESLQSVFNSMTEMLCYFNGLTEDEKEGRTNLLNAMIVLKEFHSQITSGRTFDGSDIAMGYSETKEWLQQLPPFMKIEFMRLVWIADVIETITEGTHI